MPFGPAEEGQVFQRGFLERLSLDLSGQCGSPMLSDGAVKEPFSGLSTVADNVLLLYALP
jgi:hypothetical protein